MKHGARRAWHGGPLAPGTRGRVPSGRPIALPNSAPAPFGLAVRRARRLVAAAGLEAHVGAVAVEVLALAGEADHRVPELLVVLAPVESGAVLDLHVAGRQHDLRRAFATRSACGSRSTLASMTCARSRVAGLSSSRRPWSSAGETSARAWSIHGNAASIVAAVSRTPAGSRARTRAWSGTRRSGCRARRSRSRASARAARIEVRRFVASAAVAPSVVLRFVRGPAAGPRCGSGPRSCAFRPAIRRDRSLRPRAEQRVG